MATTYSDTITTTNLPDALRTFYSAQLEFTARQMMVFDQFAEVKTDFQAERGQQVVWTIYRQMAPTIGSLTENQDVEGGQISDFQVSFTVQEYGHAVGTTRKIDALSYHGPISEIVRQLLAPQMALTLDTLARNAAWAGAPKRYAGGAANRAALTATDVATIDVIKQAAFRLAVNRVPLMNGSYVCVCHPAVIYDLKEDSEWENAGVYSDPQRLMTGEVGRIHGVRFVESHNARLANAGGNETETTLSAQAAYGTTTLLVADASGFSVGDEVTIYDAAQSAPDGTGVNEENVIIKQISGNTLTLEKGTLRAHASGSKVRKAIDIYPLMFLGGEKPYGKGVVIPPQVVVSLPTDKLRRISYVGWYALLGYGTIRDWTYEVVECAASQDAKYIFGF